ncbi:putative Tripeptidyl-peptidase sed1 [Rhexocercosporidium sp. MPI-PUGE-AT-0058]|nr:putative Tripeptidyl-peptidase sed1 [Rhexocercosporidium sp. MPI-PUGE-AT-0058]
MLSKLFVAVLAGLISLAEALPAPATHSLHEKRSSLPRLWARGDRVDKNAILPVRIGLSQQNLEDSYAHLMEVSHPDSPNFGKHWTAEQVHDMRTPYHSDNKGWIAIDMPAWQAEDLFHTEYYEHVHSSSGAVRVGSDEYYLPDIIRSHVDYITPGVKFSAALSKREVKRQSGLRHHYKPGPYKNNMSEKPWQMPPGAGQLSPDLQACGRNITPTCLKALYGIPNAHIKDSVNALGLYESRDTYAQEDLNSFFAHWAPNVPQGTYPLLNSINGGQAPVSPDSEFNTGESDIDMEIAYSLIYPQTITLYQVDNTIEAAQHGGFFNTFLDALDGSYCPYKAYNISGDSPGIDPVYPDPAPGGYKGKNQCGTYKPTRVISISYGVSEYDAPLNYTKRQCNEFLKLGLQGHTFVWASGDFGVASFPGDDSHSGCLGDAKTVYNPSFPTCPYVTNVGATRLYDTQTIKDPESALQANLTHAPLFSSSGGFANYFPVPDYQKAAVAHYFKAHDPGLPYYIANDAATNVGANGGIYNRAGRGYPDISANGAQFLIYINQTVFHTYGTSLAAPIWGSIMTLINQERTAVGKGPVGFINPVLYANPWVFNDIKNGSNPGCGSKGFAAVEGWDPVTGLGTPQYPSLLKLFLSLP